MGKSQPPQPLHHPLTPRSGMHGRSSWWPAPLYWEKRRTIVSQSYLWCFTARCGLKIVHRYENDQRAGTRRDLCFCPKGHK